MFFLGRWITSHARESSACMWRLLQQILTLVLPFSFSGQKGEVVVLLSSGVSALYQLCKLSWCQKHRPQPPPVCLGVRSKQVFTGGCRGSKHGGGGIQLVSEMIASAKWDLFSFRIVGEDVDMRHSYKGRSTRKQSAWLCLESKHSCRTQHRKNTGSC